MAFTVVYGDITKENTDAIVNAANTNLSHGGGVALAISLAAGPELQKESDEVAPIKTGSAVITNGYNLKAKYVIHTAGPIYSQHSKKEAEQLLRASYKNSLELAKEHNCKSIAFPLISAGIYGYPKIEAQKIAEEEIKDFLCDNEMEIKIVLFSKK